MSRIAKTPIVIPNNIEMKFSKKTIIINGQNGKLIHNVNKALDIQHIDNQLFFIPRPGYINGWALAGTARKLVSNMLVGVIYGFTKTLQLVGVGFRVSVDNNILNLSLGFSHLIRHQLPREVTAECPNQAEIILKSADKQAIGQVAADLRAYRRPRLYKGKGIRYADEIVRIKEVKKKS